MRNVKYLLGLLVVAIAAIGLVIGCSDADRSPTAPGLTDQQSSLVQPNVLSRANPRVMDIMSIQERHTPRLMKEPGVVGTATGIDENGDLAVLVLLESEAGRSVVPKTLDGRPVVAMVTGKLVAMKGKPPGNGGGGGTNHKAIQTPPIKLGTSGGWRHDLANGFCCGGTLGALIQVGGNQRILSNYHVFEADIVNGGNGRTARNGDPIIQPALIDIGCNANNAQDVATLVVSHSLPNNNVDCSSANVINGMVAADGEILEVGTISGGNGVSAFINQPVKKSGRTSGLTRSKVNGLNATVSITYENECAGGTAFTKTFTGQILVAKGSKFLKGGDSGSLMVEDVSNNPEAVGLLFAGSRVVAIANPIGQVLSFLNASMVGN